MTNKKVGKVGWIFTCKRFGLDLCCGDIGWYSPSKPQSKLV